MFLRWVCLATIAHLIVSALSTFNASVCGVSKHCAAYPPNCSGVDGNLDKCDFLFAYMKSPLTTDAGLIIEMDLTGRVENPNELHYVAFGFSNDEAMGSEPVIACIFRQNGPALPTHSQNIGKSNFPLSQDSGSQIRLIESSVTNGISHCKISQDFGVKLNPNFYADPSKSKVLLGAAGPAQLNSALSYHEKREIVTRNVRLASAPLAGNVKTVESTTPPASHSLELSASTRRLLLRLHGLFMIAAWIACVSLAIFSARYMRDTFGAKFAGIKLWFHVHRTLNLIAVSLIVVSAVAIALAKNLRWAGPWFNKDANQNLEAGALHSLFGAISMLLAVSQPFISLLRCTPEHPNRTIFNVFHRAIGLLAVSCALTAAFIAVYTFERHFATNPNLAKGVLAAAILTALALVVAAEVVGRGVRKRVASIELSAYTNGKHYRSDSDAFSYQQSASAETRSQKTANRVIFGLFAAVALACALVLILLIE